MEVHNPKVRIISKIPSKFFSALQQVLDIAVEVKGGKCSMTIVGDGHAYRRLVNFLVYRKRDKEAFESEWYFIDCNISKELDSIIFVKLEEF